MSVSLKQNNRSHSQISILFVLVSDKEREGEIVLPCAAWTVITISNIARKEVVLDVDGGSAEGSPEGGGRDASPEED